MFARMPFLSLLSSLGLLLLLPGLSSAQTPSAPTPAAAPGAPSTLRVSLKQAVQLALKQNPEHALSVLAAQQTARDSQISRAALLPQVEAGASMGLHQYNLQNVEKQPAPTPAGPFQFFEAGAYFNQSVLNLPLIRSYQISRENTVEAGANEKTSRENVAALVVAQYLLVLRANASLEAAQARVDLAQRLFNQASDLQKNGVAVNIDVVRAKVQLQIERQNQIRAASESRTTRYRLAEILDLPRDVVPDPTDALDFFELPAYDPAVCIDAAFQVRPEMKAIASQTRSAQLARKAATEQRLPQIEFDGFWAYQGVHPNDVIPAYLYEGTLRIPLFVGGRIQAEIARQKIVQQEVDENRKALEARIVREVKTAIDELESSRTAVDVARSAKSLAEEEVAQAQRRFQAGVTTNVEVITAQNTFSQATDNLVEALYVFNQSRANLAHAMGEIESTYTR